MAGMVYARAPQNAGVQDLVRSIPRHGHGSTLDETYGQLRYIKTTDFGATWSSLQTAGDFGSITLRVTNQYPDFQTVVTNDNNICYVLMDSTTHAVYSVTGPNFTPVVVMQEGNNDLHSVGGTNPSGWTSVGKTPNGDLFAIIWGRNASGANTFWGAKSTNNGASWGTPFIVASTPQIDSTAQYPHLSQVNSATNVFMIFQQIGTSGYPQYLGRIPVAGGAATITQIGISGEPTRNYYVGASEPIAYDDVNNWLICTFWNQAASGDIVYYSSNQGQSWSSSNIASAVRYPSVAVNTASQTPYVVSNTGPPAPGAVHHAWFSFDQLGYGGGSWVVPPQNLADAPGPYDGSRPILYINEMYWWDANRGVASNNIWGAVTPEGLITERSTDGGTTWIDQTQQWDSRVDSIASTTATMNQLAGGTNGVAYITTSFRYAPVDTMPPDIQNPVLLTPVSSHGPFVVSAVITDPSGIGASTMNYHWVPADADTDRVLPQDSIVGDTYYYHIPDSASNGHRWANGDTIWFYVDATDNNNNYGAHWMQAIVVGSAFLGVSDHPMNSVNSFALLDNYPNPFNPSTQISFDLPAMYHVTLKVFNSLGQQVATVVNGQLYEQGRHTLTFDGSQLASGIYFYTLSAGPYFASHKMVLLK
jgi:hypothetical protein